MKKKSLVAMGLAGVMTIGMCVPVLAADNTYGPTSDTQGTPNSTGTGKSQISITEPIKYTLSIPANFTGAAFDNTISLDLAIDSVNLEPGKVVKVAADKDVTLSNKTNTDVQWAMLLKNGDEDFTSVEFDSEKTTSLTLVEGNNTGKTRQAGIYEGTVQFTVTYDDATVTP